MSPDPVAVCDCKDTFKERIASKAFEGYRLAGSQVLSLETISWVDDRMFPLPEWRDARPP